MFSHATFRGIESLPPSVEVLPLKASADFQTEQTLPVPVQSSVLKEGREYPTLNIPLLGPSGHHLLPDTRVKMFIIALERKTWILEERFLHSWQGDLEYPQKKEIIYGKSWLSFAWYSWSAASWTELKSYINAIYFRWH